MSVMNQLLEKDDIKEGDELWMHAYDYAVLAQQVAHDRGQMIAEFAKELGITITIHPRMKRGIAWYVTSK